jgi:hemoglobin
MTRIASRLPPGLVRYRATPVFTRDSVPATLLAAHSVKAGMWGLLRVLHGRIRYCLEGETPEVLVVEQGGTVVIEPKVQHRVELLDANSTFLVEFHRAEATR